MATSLYLDTARLGQMSPSAQLAHIDFVRWAGEEAGSLYFDEFLRCGSPALPKRLQQRYPALTSWHGVDHLKHDLKVLAGASPQSRLVLANRSSELMRFVAMLFFGRCQNVLTTDLSWPSYQRILRRHAARTGKRITRIHIRRQIQRGIIGPEALAERIASDALANGCDGLFLPAVDNLGIRLPLEQLVSTVRQTAGIRFVVIDGAQAFCHVPFNLAANLCDFFIAGCHKWLRAYHPMGLGFCGRPDSTAYVERTLQKALRRVGINDALLTFTEQLASGSESQFGETVSLASLFSCRGAVDDRLTGDIQSEFAARQQNAAQILPVAGCAGWEVIHPHPAFRSGIILLQSRDERLQRMRPDALRRHFLKSGIAVTAYPLAKVRLSMPARPWRPFELTALKSALDSQSSATYREMIEHGFSRTTIAHTSPL